MRRTGGPPGALTVPPRASPGNLEASRVGSLRERGRMRGAGCGAADRERGDFSFPLSTSGGHGGVWKCDLITPETGDLLCIADA